MKTKVEILSAPLPLSAGTYALRFDTTNPRPDGRIKTERLSNWESWAKWPKGMRFIVESDGQTNTVFPYGAYFKARYCDPRTAILLQALDIEEESPSELLERLSGGSGAGQLALAVLDKLGISLQEIQSAIDALNAEEEICSICGLAYSNHDGREDHRLHTV